MSFIETIKANGLEVLSAVVLANFIAQVTKTILYSFCKKKIIWSMLLNTGGMPSSHTSSMIALSTSIGLISGFESIHFAIALTLSAVVMYDSAGVRRSAGQQATTLNHILKELPHDHTLNGINLKEDLGHSPKEVFAGALLGVLVSVLIHNALL
jgi:acid phosphatase family membrane protein YuiD